MLFRKSGQELPFFSQTRNTCSSWIGIPGGSKLEKWAGQTFVIPEAGKISQIEVYAATVVKPGKLTLTLHRFDAENNDWGPAIVTVEKLLTSEDQSVWIAFPLPSLKVEKGETLGFRLQSREAFLSIGETAFFGRDDVPEGEEWVGDNLGKGLNHYHYYSLAYRIKKRA